MKKLVALTLAVAVLGMNVAQAGEVKKKPLKVQQAVELQQKQDKDYEEVKTTEAGIKNGYGLMNMALIIGVGYLVYDRIENND
ncbi:MAG: hypothetical protein WBE58_14360 [Verrucomicrobiales bacterium]